VPPAGSHCSVQCFVGAPGVVLTVMSSDTLGAAAGALAAPPPTGAGVVPHAVAAAAQIAAIRR
jgi:hypothetical protein